MANPTQAPARVECKTTLESHLSADVFKALADPVRLTLVSRLAVAAGPLTVTDLGTCCGTHISGVSRHLAMLRSAGIVDAKKHGREVLYTLRSSDLSSVLRGLADALDACKLVCHPGGRLENSEEQ